MPVEPKAAGEAGGDAGTGPGRPRLGRLGVWTVTTGGNGRVSVAGMICLRPGHRTRLIYRLHVYHRRKHETASFTEADYARLLDAAHQQLGIPIVLVWDKCAVRRFAASPVQSGGTRGRSLGRRTYLEAKAEGCSLRTVTF